jgi:putative ABC transport system substrate-binding protein
VTFDPVESGFVASLARPGGNLTGLSTVNPDAGAKRVELIQEVMPRISRLAVLRNPTNSGSRFPLKETEAGTKRLGIRPQILEARSLDDLEDAFRAATKEQANALIVLADALFFAQRGRLGNLGIKQRLRCSMMLSPWTLVASFLMALASPICSGEPPATSIKFLRAPGPPISQWSSR